MATVIIPLISGTGNTAVSPAIPFSRRVINNIEEQQRKTLEDTVEGTIKLTNTSPTFDLDEQDEEVIIPLKHKME